MSVNEITQRVGFALVLLTATGTVGCLSPRPGKPVPRLGDEIVVCGQLFHTGTPVVLWMDRGGYDAYRAHCHFKPDEERASKPVSDGVARFSTFRRGLPDDVAADVQTHGWDLPRLRQHVDQFVIHYDVCGTSRRCFQVLHDIRGLSVHFMLDVDGTIYQTLDLKERAWHAGSANDRSVGIEIANIGAYENSETLDKWYATDARGRVHMTLPPQLEPSGVRTPDFVARPARDVAVVGTIHGRRLVQYEFTDQQYDALIKLTATLCRVLPEIKPDYPRDAEGQLRCDVLPPDELANYHGLLGHWHITTDKVDPGPAFDWDRVVKGARRYVRR